MSRRFAWRVAAPSRCRWPASPRRTSVCAHGNRVTLARPGIREWYAAGPLGIEQGFTLAHRPAGATAKGVTLSLAVGGSLHAQAAGSDVNFVGRAWRYRGALRRPDRGRRDRAAPAQHAQRAGRASAHRGQRPRRALPAHHRPARPAGRQARPATDGPTAERAAGSARASRFGRREHRAHRRRASTTPTSARRGCSRARDRRGASRATSSCPTDEAQSSASSVSASRCRRTATRR